MISEKSSSLIPKQTWFQLEVPACLDSLLTIQTALREFAARHGFQAEQSFKLDLALEELVTTVLRFTLDEEALEPLSFRLEIRLVERFLKVSLNSRGLPFNWSMIPEYDPRRPPNVALPDNPAEEGLSAFLLKQVVDQYQLVNLGKDGVSIQLAWHMAGGHIASLEPGEGDLKAASQRVASSQESLSPVRCLQAGEEIQVSRLVYRSYGYTYVNETLYYPDGIREAIVSGTLDSRVVSTQSGEMVGHIALMRDKPDAPMAEWGMAVVSPRFRGRGLMKIMVNHIVQVLASTEVQVAFAHAVAIHPYTQKTALEFDFQPTALQLGFAPAIKFKQLDESAHHRESTFICMRFFQPVSETVVYLPAWHQAWLKSLISGFSLLQVAKFISVGEVLATAGSESSLAQQCQQRRKAHQSAFEHSGYNTQALSNSRLSSNLDGVLNLAQIQFEVIGRDHAALLNREVYRLSSEKVAVIYLQVNLADPFAPVLVASAETLGFFVSGWMPMSPWPMTLSLQYLNHVIIDPNAVTTANEAFENIKNRVFAERTLCDYVAFSQFERQTIERVES